MESAKSNHKILFDINFEFTPVKDNIKDTTAIKTPTLTDDPMDALVVFFQYNP